MWPLGFPCWRTLIADFYLFHRNTCTRIIGTVNSDKHWNLRTIFFFFLPFLLVFHQFVQFTHVLGLNLGLSLNITNFFSLATLVLIFESEAMSWVHPWSLREHDPAPNGCPRFRFFAVLSNLFKHKLVFALIFVVLGFLLFLMLKVTSLSQMSLPFWCCNTFS